MNTTHLPIEVTAAAHELGISRQSLHYHINTGRIPTYKIGHLTVILPDDWSSFRTRYIAGEFSNSGSLKKRGVTQ